MVISTSTQTDYEEDNEHAVSMTEPDDLSFISMPRTSYVHNNSMRKDGNTQNASGMRRDSNKPRDSHHNKPSYIVPEESDNDSPISDYVENEYVKNSYKSPPVYDKRILPIHSNSTPKAYSRDNSTGNNYSGKQGYDHTEVTYANPSQFKIESHGKSHNDTFETAP